MRILLSNDDGHRAPGIQSLRGYLDNHANITIVAPSKNVSACSSSLSVTKNLSVKKYNTSHYSVNGTAADSVHIATRGLFKSKIHQVISGINFGSNMGDDVIYSGTVAAAIEGRFCQYSPIAISITNREPKYLDDIQQKLDLFLPKFLGIDIKNIILNINIPDIAFKKIRGTCITKLGSRKVSKNARKIYKNKTPFWCIGDVGPSFPPPKGSDFYAVRKNYISITPISIDMTNHQIIKSLKTYEQ